MISMRMRVFASMILVVSLVITAFGQQPTQPRASTPTLPPSRASAPTPATPAAGVAEPREQQPKAETHAPTAAKGPDFVEEKGFKGRVFEIKHRNPSALAQAISLLGSGFKGARMQWSDEFSTLTVRDFPENIAAIEEAIKRLDVAEAPSPDMEFHVHVLIASNDAAASGEFPPELGDVIKQLKATLNYKSYGLMNSSMHRSREGRQRVENQGVAQSKLFELNTPGGNPIFYNYSIGPVTLDKTASGAATMRIEQFRFNMRVPLNLGTAEKSLIQYENVGFNTPVGIRDGEKVVVGTTAIGNKGLIVVLTTRVLK